MDIDFDTFSPSIFAESSKLLTGNEGNASLQMAAINEMVTGFVITNLCCLSVSDTVQWIACLLVRFHVGNKFTHFLDRAEL